MKPTSFGAEITVTEMEIHHVQDWDDWEANLRERVAWKIALELSKRAELFQRLRSDDFSRRSLRCELIIATPLGYYEAIHVAEKEGQRKLIEGR